MRHLGLCVVVLLALVSAAEAGVTRVEITRREPFADGQAFVGAGAYEKIVGRFHGELDPTHPLNRGIVDLDLAPKNARGRVEYSADFYVLRPVDAAKGNGALLYDVNNRGRKLALMQLNSAEPSNDPSTAAHAGNGFLMRRGFSVVWSGWLPGMPAGDDLLRLSVPIARGAAGPLEQTVWDEVLLNSPGDKPARLTFRATSTDPAHATLSVRDGNARPATVIPAGRWEFVDDRSIRLLPAGTPFAPGLIYQLVYRAADPPVAGIGFAATRDLVAFLRHDASAGNPLAGAIRRSLAHGTSQSGRYLRDFVYRGFNEDEAGHRVFDGINPHVATARMFMNHRFAQPNRGSQGAHGSLFYPDVSFPFSYEAQADPFGGKTDGLLVRCTARGNCPKIVHTVSANEYWHAAHSLVTTDPMGTRDATLPDGVRVWAIAGTQHVGGRPPTMPAGVCALAPNPVDLRPVLRTAVAALDAWVKDGTPPPASRHPRVADGSLVRMAELRFPRIPGVELPAGPGPRPRLDYGPEFERGIFTRVPPEPTGQGYVVLVPQVDADGNDIAGVRLPAIEVPLGTATGWNTRTAAAGAPGALCGLDGGFVPFAQTKVLRESAGDPRPSLEERYGDRSAVSREKVSAATAALKSAGYLLEEDAQRIVNNVRP